MADPSEAACLLQTGALYHRRLGLRPASGSLVFAGSKRGAFSLYFGDAPTYHFDLEGRWQRAFVGDVHYLKGLDGDVVAIARVREGASLVLRRRPVGFAEAGDLDATIREAALDLLGGLGAGTLGRVEPPAGVRPIAIEELREALERVARWDAAAWFAHRERYLATYGLLPLLPPDAQNAAILQATLGHAEGLAFGGGDAAEHYVRTPAEFAAHIREVVALLGRRLVQCRGIFLGGGDLLRRPPDDVAAYLEETARVFQIDPGSARRRPRDLPDYAPSLEGISAFLDCFDPALSDDAWRRFRSLHLCRMHLGVESGAPGVRAVYGKDWPDEALRATVAGLKGAGIGVGVLVLVGAGGAEHADQHAAATAELVNALDLGPGDLVSLMDADEVGGASARDHLRRLGLTPLAAPARSEQQARLKEALNPIRSLRGAMVAPYRLEKQWS